MSSLARVNAASLSAPSSIGHLWAYLTHLAHISRWPLTTWGDLSYLETRIPNPLFNLFYGDVHTLTLTQKSEAAAFAGQTPSLWIQGGNASPMGSSFFSEFLPLKDPMPLQGVTFNVSHKRTDLMPTSSFAIQRISSYEELSSFDRISAACFDHEEGMALEFMRGLSLKEGKNPLQTYLVYNEEMLIGGFQLFSHQGTRGLYWGCVLPEYQQQGIGSSVLAQVLKDSKELGYDHVVSSLMPSCLGVLKRFTPSETIPFRLYAVSPTPTMWHQCH